MIVDEMLLMVAVVVSMVVGLADSLLAKLEDEDEGIVGVVLFTAELEGWEVVLGVADEDGVGVGVRDGLLLGGAADDWATAASVSPPAPFKEPSNTTKFAVVPLGTVTTQKFAPPAPSVLLPTISLIVFWDGSIAHGSPLQPGPLQTISTPQVGMTFLKGVAGSRYIGFQASLMNVLPF